MINKVSLSNPTVSEVVNVTASYRVLKLKYVVFVSKEMKRLGPVSKCRIKLFHGFSVLHAQVGYTVCVLKLHSLNYQIIMYVSIVHKVFYSDKIAKRWH